MMRMSTPSASSRHAPSCRRSCQRRSIRWSCSRFHAAPFRVGAARCHARAAAAFPTRSGVRLVRARSRSEHVARPVRALTALQDGGESPLGVERDSPVLLVLGRRARDADLAGLPVHALVLDQQHLAAPAAQLQRADDAVVQQRSDELMLGRVHLLQRGIEQLLLLLSREPPIAHRLRLLVHPHTESMER